MFWAFKLASWISQNSNLISPSEIINTDCDISLYFLFDFWMTYCSFQSIVTFLRKSNANLLFPWHYLSCSNCIVTIKRFKCYWLYFLLWLYFYEWELLLFGDFFSDHWKWETGCEYLMHDSLTFKLHIDHRSYCFSFTFNCDWRGAFHWLGYSFYEKWILFDF